eukprot:scaffold654_cov274-Pinguiococcus_pyrenoidosus.AAC.2
MPFGRVPHEEAENDPEGRHGRAEGHDDARHDAADVVHIFLAEDHGVHALVVHGAHAGGSDETAEH